MNPQRKKEKIILIFLTFIFIIFIAQAVYKNFSSPIKFTSPLPKNLNFSSVTSFSFFKSPPAWKPKEGTVLAAADINKPEVSAKSALILDLNQGDILYEKNSHQSFSPASTIKIMTATIALERGLPDNTLIIPEVVTQQPANLMGLSTGEKVTIKDLLYGLLLASGNDAAYALAEGIAGSQVRFVNWMNEKAEKLGAKDTHFVNSSGLDEDDEISNTTTAYDLALITRYALTTHPLIREIVGTKYFTIPYEEGKHKAFVLENGTPLTGKYPGVIGVKEGYTPQAGLSLVSLIKRDDQEILVVLLGAEDRRGDAEVLIEYGFEVLKKK